MRCIQKVKTFLVLKLSNNSISFSNKRVFFKYIYEFLQTRAKRKKKKIKGFYPDLIQEWEGMVREDLNSHDFITLINSNKSQGKWLKFILKWQSIHDILRRLSRKEDKDDKLAKLVSRLMQDLKELMEKGIFSEKENRNVHLGTGKRGKPRVKLKLTD